MFVFLYDLTIDRWCKFLYSTALQKTRTFICCWAFQLCCKCIWIQ